MSIRHKLGYAVIATLGMMAFISWGSNYPPAEVRLAALLQISELPGSVAEVECHSRGIEDDFTQCTGVAAIEEMDILASGWPFQLATSNRPSSSGPRPICLGLPDRGVHPTHCFKYQSAEFGHGGAGFMAFGYDESSGRFYASTARN